jgi:type IV pilus assembly protein PilY1
MKIFQASSWQPITSTPVVTSIPSSGTGNPKVIVAFGTGQKLPVTISQAEKYAATTSTQKQAIYGIWDANMTAWNATSTDTKYAALTQSSPTTAVAISSSALQAQTVTTETTTTRNLSNITMCWVGMTGCDASSTASAMGWVLNLPTSTEQVIYNPLVSNGDLFVNTTIPATSSLFTCSSTAVAGWTLGINLGNGGAGSVPAFDGNISGYSLNGAGTPAVYNYGSSSYLGTNTNDEHQFKSKKLAPQPGVGKRVTWTKMR